MIECKIWAAYLLPLVASFFTLGGIALLVSAGSDFWADIKLWQHRLIVVAVGLVFQTVGYLMWLDWYSRCM